MTQRRWIAIGLAVVISLPLIPFLHNWIEDIVGADGPFVIHTQPDFQSWAPGLRLSASVSIPPAFQPWPEYIAKLGLELEDSKRFETELVGRGWYALDFASLKSPEQGSRVDFEYTSDAGRHKHVTLTPSGAVSGLGVAWIYFNHPGELRVFTPTGKPDTVLRGVSYAEFLDRATDITFAKALLAVLFLTEILEIGAWILVVCVLQWSVYKLIGMLPRGIRGRTRRELNLLLTVAKWGGVACYVVWTVKDLLVEIGAVFVM
jgi:hypothetical protein